MRASYILLVGLLMDGLACGCGSDEGNDDPVGGGVTTVFTLGR